MIIDAPLWKTWLRAQVPGPSVWNLPCFQLEFSSSPSLVQKLNWPVKAPARFDSLLEKLGRKEEEKISPWLPTGFKPSTNRFFGLWPIWQTTTIGRSGDIHFHWRDYLSNDKNSSSKGICQKNCREIAKFDYWSKSNETNLVLGKETHSNVSQSNLRWVQFIAKRIQQAIQKFDELSSVNL